MLESLGQFAYSCAITIWKHKENTTIPEIKYGRTERAETHTYVQGFVAELMYPTAWTSLPPVTTL